MPLGTILLGSCQWHGHVVRHLVPGFVITGSPMCLPWRWTISGYLVSQAFSNKHSYNIHQINFASLSALARLWAACTRHSNQCAINSVATQMANRPLQQVVPSLLLVSPLLLLVSSQSNNLSKHIHIPQIKSNLEGSSDSDFPKSQSFSIHWFHGYSMDIPWIPMGKPWEAMGSHGKPPRCPCIHPTWTTPMKANFWCSSWTCWERLGESVFVSKCISCIFL